MAKAASYDSEGNEYLDMTAGIAVNCLDIISPVVVKTIKKQADANSR